MSGGFLLREEDRCDGHISTQAHLLHGVVHHDSRLRVQQLGFCPRVEQKGVAAKAERPIAVLIFRAGHIVCLPPRDVMVIHVQLVAAKRTTNPTINSSGRNYKNI